MVGELVTHWEAAGGRGQSGSQAGEHNGGSGRRRGGGDTAQTLRRSSEGRGSPGSGRRSGKLREAGDGRGHGKASATGKAAVAVVEIQRRRGGVAAHRT